MPFLAECIMCLEGSLESLAPSCSFVLSRIVNIFMGMKSNFMASILSIHIEQRALTCFNDAISEAQSHGSYKSLIVGGDYNFYKL